MFPYDFISRRVARILLHDHSVHSVITMLHSEIQGPSLVLYDQHLSSQDKQFLMVTKLHPGVPSTFHTEIRVLSD